MRETVNVDGKPYVVVRSSKRRLVLDKLDGDFSDYRVILGLTQIEMAEKLGITQGYLSKLETGVIVKVPFDLVKKCERMLKGKL